MAHADDELLSALLDGESPEGDAAHVDTCDVCQARLATLRRAADAVASPVIPPSPHFREAALAAAMRAADEPLRTAALNAVGRPVPMRSARRKAAAGPRRMNTMSAAAALVVALAVGGWAISQIGTNTRDANTNTALSSGARNKAEAATPTAGLGAQDDLSMDSGQAVAGGIAGGAGATTAASTTAVSAASEPGYDAGDIGQLRKVDDVLAIAKNDLQKPEDVQAQHTSRIGEPMCPIPTGSELLWHAVLDYNGTAAVAQVRTLTNSRWILEIHNRQSSDCGLLASQEFEPTTPH